MFNNQLIFIFKRGLASFRHQITSFPALYWIARRFALERL